MVDKSTATHLLIKIAVGSTVQPTLELTFNMSAQAPFNPFFGALERDNYLPQDLYLGAFDVRTIRTSLKA